MNRRIAVSGVAAVAVGLLLVALARVGPCGGRPEERAGEGVPAAACPERRPVAPASGAPASPGVPLAPPDRPPPRAPSGPPALPDARAESSPPTADRESMSLLVLGAVVAPGASTVRGDVLVRLGSGAAGGPERRAPISADGRFSCTLESVPAGGWLSVLATVRIPGYPATEFCATQNGAEPLIDLGTLELPLPSRIHGTIRGRGGDAASGVTVTCDGASAVTGEDGRFVLPPAAGRERLTLTIGGPRGDFHIEQPVVPGDEAAIDLTLGEATVRGVVRDMDGAPAAAASVGAIVAVDAGRVPRHGRMAIANAECDAQGRFELAALPPGPAQLLAIGAWRGQTYRTVTPATVPAEGAVEIDLRLPAAAATGAILPPGDAPGLVTAYVTLVAAGDEMPGDVLAFRLASFRVQDAAVRGGLDRGAYTVGASAAGRASIFAVARDGRVAGPVAVELEEGRAVAAPPLRYPEIGTVGRVTLLPPEESASAFTRLATVEEARTGAFAGSFPVGDTSRGEIALPEGDYRVTIFAPGEAPRARTVEVRVPR